MVTKNTQTDNTQSTRHKWDEQHIQEVLSFGGQKTSEAQTSLLLDSTYDGLSSSSKKRAREEMPIIAQVLVATQKVTPIYRIPRARAEEEGLSIKTFDESCRDGELILVGPTYAIDLCIFDTHE